MEGKSLCSNGQASTGASGTLDVVGPQLYELSNLEVIFQAYVNASDVVAWVCHTTWWVSQQPWKIKTTIEYLDVIIEFLAWFGWVTKSSYIFHDHHYMTIKYFHISNGWK